MAHQGYAMQELLVRVPDSLRDARLQLMPRHIGAICLDTQPSLILIRAFEHAQYTCLKEFSRCSELLVNGIPYKEYFNNYDLQDSLLQTRFPYVDIHLYFVFFEVMKNALL